MKYFGEQLRKARTAAGYSQEALATMLGMARTNYIPFETGKKYPGKETWEELSKLLSVSVTDIKAWRVIDQFGKDVVLAAFELQFPPDSPEGMEIRHAIANKNQALSY